MAGRHCPRRWPIRLLHSPHDALTSSGPGTRHSIPTRSATAPFSFPTPRESEPPPKGTHWADRLLFGDPSVAPTSSDLTINVSSDAEADRPRIGRVLPDLSWVDPVQIQRQKEAEERAARRRSSPRQRRKAASLDEVQISMPLEQGTALVGGWTSGVETHAASEPVVSAGLGHGDVPVTHAAGIPNIVTGIYAEHATTRRGERSALYQMACRKAKSRGLPVPPLPRGERWKRRLPVMCR